jgi:hypothetical protein
MARKPKPKKTSKKRAVLPLEKVKRKRPPRRRIIKTVQKRRATQANIPFAPEPESMTEVEIETERKLSAKIIVGKRIGQVTEAKDLFTVIGIATGTRIGQSNYGEWTGLKGEFEVVRCEDGKVLQAPIMILPDPAMELLAGSHWPVHFAFLLRVVPSSNSAGFEYEVRQIVPPRAHDALAGFRVAVETREVGSGG